MKMDSAPSALFDSAEGRIWRWGITALASAVVLLGGFVILLAITLPAWGGLLVPLCLVLALALYVGAKQNWHPALPTLTILAWYAPLSGHNTGLQVSEILFAFAYVLFLAGWFGSRIFVYRERIIRTPTDAGLAALLIFVTISPLIGLANGASFSDLQADLVNISFMSLYFPLREVGSRYPRGLEMLAALILIYGVVSVLRVVITLSAAFESAEHAWQIARGRVTMGELFMYQAALLCLALASLQRKWRYQLAWVIGFGVFTIGLLLTQWRSYYVALALGIGVLWIVLRGKERLRLLGFVILGSVVAAGFAYLTFGDTVILMGYGLLDRALSLGTATSDDISLLNRGLESRRVVELILHSPIVGYGPGVSFGFFDAIFERTWIKPYAHNAYLSMIFKYGLIVTLPFLLFWVAHAIGSLKRAWEGDADRAYNCFVAAALLPLFASHLVSAAFNTGDSVIAYTLLFGFGGALAGRSRAAFSSTQ